MRLLHGLLCALPATPALAQLSADALLAPPAGSLGQFGLDVDLDGNQLIVSHREQGAWVYELNENGEPTSVTPLPGTDPFFPTQTEWSVSIDGDLALIGYWQDNALVFDQGGATIFERKPGGQWLAEDELSIANLAGEQQFGRRVALQGQRVVVSEPHGAFLQFPGLTGTVYVYEPLGQGQWGLQAELRPSPVAAGIAAGFGSGIALDGDRLLIGAPGDGETSQGVWAQGAAYIFERQPDGSWNQMHKLEAANEIEDHRLGQTVALHGDLALCGSSPAFVAEGQDWSGSATLFERTPAGEWLQIATLKAPQPSNGDGFGVDVAIEADRAVVASLEPRAVHVFRRQSTGLWEHELELQSSPNGAYFHPAVALSDARLAFGNPAFGDGEGQLSVLRTGELYRGGTSISLASGGSQALELRAGSEHANALYLMLGSASGTSPGLPLPGGSHLPLQLDPYLNFLLQASGGGLVAPFVGSLDAQGFASASLQLPPGAAPTLAGTELHHAYVALDPLTSAVEFASNAVRVQLEP